MPSPPNRDVEEGGVVSMISCDACVERKVVVVTAGGGRVGIGERTMEDDVESTVAEDVEPAEEGGVANGRAGTCTVKSLSLP